MKTQRRKIHQPHSSPKTHAHLTVVLSDEKRHTSEPEPNYFGALSDQGRELNQGLIEAT